VTFDAIRLVRWTQAIPLVADRPRRLLNTRGGFFRPSLDGGLLLLELFLSSRRCSSATCCFSAAFSWRSAVFSSHRLSTSRRSAPIVDGGLNPRKSGA
jgi:hypothetical protein